VLVNLFLHYAFDAWMAREYPTVLFERYADDAIVHCVTEAHLHADMTHKQQAIDRTKPFNAKPGRYQPPDTLLAFLETL
jgi:hypothetical protein